MLCGSSQYAACQSGPCTMRLLCCCWQRMSQASHAPGRCKCQSEPPTRYACMQVILHALVDHHCIAACSARTRSAACSHGVCTHARAPVCPVLPEQTES